MTITGVTDLGDGIRAVTVDADPRSTAVDAPAGSLILWSGLVFFKVDSGSTTNMNAIPRKNNLAATTDPTVNDDNTLGYGIGSLWAHTVDGHMFICTDPSTGAAVWKGIISGGAGAPIRLASLIPDLSLVVVTKHEIGGRLAARVVAGAVNGTPTTQDHLNSGTCRILVQVTTYTAGPTLRLTGTSYSPLTGTTTPGDTEDIAIGATGWYQSAKRWQGTVVLSSVGGLNVILNSHLWSPFQIGVDYTVQALYAEYKVTGATNQSHLVMQKFTPVTGFTTVYDRTISNHLGDDSVHFRYLNSSVFESLGQGGYVFEEAQRLTDYRLSLNAVTL